MKNLLLMKNLLILLFGLLILLAGCGYHMLSSFSSWPQGVDKLYIETLENQTGEPGLDAVVTEAFIQEFWRWPGSKVVNREEAEAIFSGVITEYEAYQPVSFDKEHDIREYELIIHMNVELKEAATGKVFWSEKNRVIHQDYQYFEGDLASSEAAEKEAQTKAARDMARELVSKSFMRGF